MATRVSEAQRVERRLLAAMIARPTDDLARARPGQVIAWPPGRNQPCWCGSTRKYKKCCSAPKAGGNG